MPRIHWLDRDTDEASVVVIDWRVASLIIATLFLNLAFCERGGLVRCDSGSLALDVGSLAVTTLLLMSVFFVGPALATQALKLPLFELLEHTFGTIPGWVLRPCAVVFLSIWVAKLVAAPALWALAYVPGRERPLSQTIPIAAGIVLFLCLTGLQSFRTAAKLALFTNKLCIAMLIAAFIRVHDGWASLPAGFHPQSPPFEQICRSVSALAFYVAPLLLLTAGTAGRCAGRKDVAISGLMGLVLPMFLALSISLIIGVATVQSSLYRPSLEPTVFMALFSRVAGSATASRMFIAAITTFGAARFGVRSLWDASGLRPFGNWHWAVIASVVAVITSLAINPYAEGLTMISDLAATCLVMSGAVLTAYFLGNWRDLESSRLVDWIAVLALVAGMTTRLFFPREYASGPKNWWSPWLMPSYCIAFLVCLCGRALRTARSGVIGN